MNGEPFPIHSRVGSVHFVSCQVHFWDISQCLSFLCFRNILLCVFPESHITLPSSVITQLRGWTINSALNTSHSEQRFTAITTPRPSFICPAASPSHPFHLLAHPVHSNLQEQIRSNVKDC